jgi:hypothetical protein
MNPAHSQSRVGETVVAVACMSVPAPPVYGSTILHMTAAEFETKDPAVAAHRSRWGWHACDHATYLEVKEYHKLLYRSLRQHNRWVAWDNKTVYKAAVEPASECCHQTATEAAAGDGRRSHRFPGQRTRADLPVYARVLAAYRALRMPCVTASEAVAAAEASPLPLGWRLQLADMRAYYAEHPAGIRD